MDFNWDIFRMSLGLVAFAFGMLVTMGKKSALNYRIFFLLAALFLAYMYVVCAGWISEEIVRIIGVIGSVGLVYSFYLNKKGK